MKIVFVNNGFVPYRHHFFDYFFKKYEAQTTGSLVLYLTEKESVRDWTVDKEKIKYDHFFLKQICQRRNKRTTTSDFVVNYSYLKYIKDADVVFTLGYSYLTYMIMCLYAKLVGVKTICFCETNISDKNQRGRFKKIIKRTLINNLYDHFAVPGSNAKEYLLDLGINLGKISIIGNSAPFERKKSSYSISNTEADRTNDKERVSSNSNVRLLYVGRLSDEKNIEFSLRALESLSEQVDITIVGSGPKFDIIKEIAQASKHNYLLKDFCDRETLPLIYQAHDVLLLPSRSETWGLVVNEAIEFGLAILASDCVGCAPELIKDNGELFSIDSRSEFLSKAEKIISSIDRYKINSSLIHQENDKSHNAKAMMECLISLVN